MCVYCWRKWQCILLPPTSCLCVLLVMTNPMCCSCVGEADHNMTTSNYDIPSDKYCVYSQPNLIVAHDLNPAAVYVMTAWCVTWWGDDDLVMGSQGKYYIPLTCNIQWVRHFGVEAGRKRKSDYYLLLLLSVYWGSHVPTMLPSGWRGLGSQWWERTVVSISLLLLYYYYSIWLCNVCEEGSNLIIQHSKQ